MTRTDLVHGLRLSDAAGWNQTERDWQRGFDLFPQGCFLAEAEGEVVGTVMSCRFGSIAWVAMMLVEPRFRRRGIGRALMEQALRHLEDGGIRTVRLDATPLGQPLYEQLGFVAQFRLARYAGPAPEGGGATDPGITTVPPSRWAELVAHDRTITGTERGELLRRLFGEHPEEVRGIEGAQGYHTWMASRAGRHAVQLGPCLGSEGARLLADACQRQAGKRVYFDAPVDHDGACRWAEQRGMTVQRHLTRMVRGEPVVERLELLWASSGPAKG